MTYIIIGHLKGTDSFQIYGVYEKLYKAKIKRKNLQDSHQSYYFWIEDWEIEQ